MIFINWLRKISTNCIFFQPSNGLDIWHDLVGDYFKVSWGGGSILLIYSRQSMPVICNVGKNLRQVFPTFKNRAIGVSELSVSLVSRSIVTCIMSRYCRTACVTGDFGRRTEFQYFGLWRFVGVFNLWGSIPTMSLHLTSDMTWLVIILMSLEVAKVIC